MGRVKRQCRSSRTEVVTSHGEQHVDKLAQRTDGTVSSGDEGAVGQGVVCRRRSERTDRIARGAFCGW